MLRFKSIWCFLEACLWLFWFLMVAHITNDAKDQILRGPSKKWHVTTRIFLFAFVGTPLSMQFTFDMTFSKAAIKRNDLTLITSTSYRHLISPWANVLEFGRKIFLPFIVIMLIRKAFFAPINLFFTLLKLLVNFWSWFFCPMKRSLVGVIIHLSKCSVKTIHMFHILDLGKGQENSNCTPI